MKLDVPECCGKPMVTKMETFSFIEVGCEICGDVVYIKKIAALKPALIDD
jgi:hypothetical protein